MPEITPYPGNPDYGVTRDGRVFRIVRSHKHGRRVPFELVLLARNGYLTAGLTGDDGESRPHKVHRLVALTFLPAPATTKLDVAHKNGKRKDNRVENLYWATRKQNMADALAHGTRCRGETTGTSKLTEQQVRDIRRRASLGAVQQRLCEEYGMSPAAISQIVNKHRWAHVG